MRDPVPDFDDWIRARIAAVLGCTASTVRSQIHRALGRLRQVLGTTEEVSRS
jgi:DNA-directed RNA polymerase specialized sigma24 family protein